MKAQSSNLQSSNPEGRRIRGDLLARVESLCDRVLDVADALARQGVSRRIIDQFVGAGTAVGANVFESDEAMSRADFVKCLAIASKEANETRFWLRLIGRRGWIDSPRLADLEQECQEVRRVMGAMIVATRDGKARENN